MFETILILFVVMVIVFALLVIKIVRALCEQQRLFLAEIRRLNDVLREAKWNGKPS